MDANHGPLAALQIEHEEIRAVLNKLEGCLKKAGSASSGESVNSLINQLNEITSFMDKDLEIHFKREEDALFPVLGNYIGMETGPINVMLIEHKNCRDLSEDFKVKIANFSQSKDYKLLINAGNSFGLLLSEHEDKEDNILFRMAEMHLSQDEKRGIMEKMQAIN
ncbi:MAG: hemerythrin domain-containing protein [bacterium]